MAKIMGGVSTRAADTTCLGGGQIGSSDARVRGRVSIHSLGALCAEVWHCVSESILCPPDDSKSYSPRVSHGSGRMISASFRMPGGGLCNRPAGRSIRAFSSCNDFLRHD